MATATIAASISALMPLVTRDLLHGGAQTYGIMLGFFGVGAVIGALYFGEVRKRMSGEAALRACTLSMGGAIAAVALSHEPVLTAVAMVLAGAVWVMAVTLFNIGGAVLHAALGGRPITCSLSGCVLRGYCDRELGLGTAHRYRRRPDGLLISATLMLLSARLGCWLGMPRITAHDEDGDAGADPKVRLPLTNPSRPLVVEIEYRVAQENARFL